MTMAQNIPVTTTGATGPNSSSDCSPKKLNPPVDYMSSDKPFVIIRFIVECGKLDSAKRSGISITVCIETILANF